METTSVFFLLFIILFDIHAQVSSDNGQILINNQGSPGNLVSTDGGLANANGQITVGNTGRVTLSGPAPQPKDQTGRRRRKRQQPSKFCLPYSSLKQADLL
jgi:hypothetical protein